MISYAQNGEDVVLARLFDRQHTGVWIDVGAGDPVQDSVTKHLSDRGWWGLNIEPEPALLERLVAERPRDRNLGVALSDRPGQAILHVSPDVGRSTLVADLVDPTLGEWSETSVPVMTLATVAEEHGLTKVDLLKIDVEGHEREVLRGADLRSLRARVVLVEATLPGSPEASYAAWEPTLLDAGYRCVLDDGLNRFYVAVDDDEAAAALRAPANVHDAFTRWSDQRHADTLTQAIDDAVTYAASLEARVGQLDAELREAATNAAALARAADEAARYARSLEARVAELEGEQTLGRVAVERLHAVDAVLAEIERTSQPPIT